jgi:hypothetical protein
MMWSVGVQTSSPAPQQNLFPPQNKTITTHPSKTQELFVMGNNTIGNPIAPTSGSFALLRQKWEPWLDSLLQVQEVSRQSFGDPFDKQVDS